MREARAAIGEVRAGVMRDVRAAMRGVRGVKLELIALYLLLSALHCVSGGEGEEEWVEFVYEHHLLQQVLQQPPTSRKVLLEATAFNRLFVCLLVPNPDPPRLTVSVSGVIIPQPLPIHFLQGTVLGIEGSWVQGNVVNGLFSGFLTLGKSDIYNVERFENKSMIYKARSNDNYTTTIRLARGLPISCGLSIPSVRRSVMEDMENASITMSNQAGRQVHTDTIALPGYYIPVKHSYHRFTSVSLIFSMTGTYDGAINSGLDTCYIKIVTDVHYWQYIQSKIPNGDKQNIQVEVIASIVHMVDVVNVVFSKTQFVQFKGAGVRIANIQIYTTDDCASGHITGRSWQCNNNIIDPSVVLSKFTKMAATQAYCLVYLVTAIDFLNGVLGLAYPSTTTSSISGICGTSNSGLVTARGYGGRFTSLGMGLTLTHEIGHSFGAQHDDADENSKRKVCQRGYVMNSQSNKGSVDDADFSICSKKSIAEVLNTMEAGKRSFCFKERLAAFCGNSVLEDGEECDCGDELSCPDNCCHFLSIENTDNNKSCTLKENAECSPFSNLCCTTECTFKNVNTYCAPSTECREKGVCIAKDDHSRTVIVCNRKKRKDNTTFCDSNQRTCQNGECTGSVCAYFGLEHCQITQEEGASRREQCYTACKKEGKCTTSFELTNLFKPPVSESAKYLPGGSSCNDGRGYCDYLGYCRRVELGPDMWLLPERFITTFLNFAKNFWWVFVLGVMFIGICVWALILFCAVYTPSNNPLQRSTPDSEAAAVRELGRQILNNNVQGDGDQGAEHESRLTGRPTMNNRKKIQQGKKKNVSYTRGNQTRKSKALLPRNKSVRKGRKKGVGRKLQHKIYHNLEQDLQGPGAGDIIPTSPPPTYEEAQSCYQQQGIKRIQRSLNRRSKGEGSVNELKQPSTLISAANTKRARKHRQTKQKNTTDFTSIVL